MNVKAIGLAVGGLVLGGLALFTLWRRSSPGAASAAQNSPLLNRLGLQNLGSRAGVATQAQLTAQPLYAPGNNQNPAQAALEAEIVATASSLGLSSVLSFGSSLVQGGLSQAGRGAAAALTAASASPAQTLGQATDAANHALSFGQDYVDGANTGQSVGDLIQETVDQQSADQFLTPDTADLTVTPADFIPSADDVPTVDVQAALADPTIGLDFSTADGSGGGW